MRLTRSEVLALEDITIKEITVIETIPVWGGRTLFIKQLSRGLQDIYNKRQFDPMTIKQEASAKKTQKDSKQEITGISMYGHDVWLFVHSVCDEKGVLEYTDADIPKLNEKSGEAIGWVAKEVIEFSGMAGDADLVDDIKK